MRTKQYRYNKQYLEEDYGSISEGIEANRRKYKNVIREDDSDQKHYVFEVMDVDATVFSHDQAIITQQSLIEDVVQQNAELREQLTQIERKLDEFLGN